MECPQAGDPGQLDGPVVGARSRPARRGAAPGRPEAGGDVDGLGLPEAAPALDLLVAGELREVAGAPRPPPPAPHAGRAAHARGGAPDAERATDRLPAAP